MEFALWLDIAQMDEPFLAPRLVNTDSRKFHLKRNPPPPLTS
jgi:hypothetical protein